MTIVVIMKVVPSVGFMPLWNMWWPHTIQRQERRCRSSRRPWRGSRRSACARRPAGCPRRCPWRAGSGCRPRGGRRTRTGAARGAARRRPRAGRSWCRAMRSKSSMAERRGQHRQREQQEDGGDEQRPDGQRHAEQRHARRAHVDDGRDVVDRAHQRRDAEDDQADAPEVLAPVRRRCTPGTARQRRVRRPARRGVRRPRRRSSDSMMTPATAATQNDSMLSSGKAMSRAPIMSGMRKLPKRADQDRHDHEEDHDRGVHGEEHVVGLGLDDAAGRRLRGPSRSPGTAVSGQASCQRTISARRPPRTIMIRPMNRNCLPIIL